MMNVQLSSSCIKIYIRLHNGNGCSLQVQPTIHFQELIQAINKMQLQLPQLYTIVLRGKHVKNYQLTLEQLGIRENSILHIEEAIDRSQRSINMDVCVCYNQQNFVVKSTPADSVLILKQTIHKLTKISPKHQILVFNGRKLENQQTLQSYKIYPNSLICLISTAKIPEPSEVHSDYDQVINDLLKNETHLIDSAISLCDIKQSIKIRLFRSDSIDRKNSILCPPIEVEIKQRNLNEDNESEYDTKDFNFDLFKSFGNSNPIAFNMGFNPLDTLKPLKALKFIMKDDELLKENDSIEKQVSVELFSSAQSFRT